MALEKIFRGMQNGAETIEANFKELGGEYSSVKIIPKNGVVDYHANEPGMAHKIEFPSFTIFWLQGAWKNVTKIPTTVATLPVGFRPSKYVPVSMPSSVEKHARISIEDNGDIDVKNTTTEHTTADSWYPVRTMWIEVNL